MPSARNKPSGARIIDRKPVPSTLVLAMLLAVPVAHGGEFAYSIGYLGEYTSNSYRDATELEEITNSAILSLGYQENTGDLRARVRAQGQYRQYREETFDNESLYFVDAAAIWSIVPKTLNWTLLDRYDQLVADVTQADTPDNRVNINALSTGPDVFLHFGRLNTLILGARYGNVLYGDNPGQTNNDNDRYSGQASWIYQATPEMSYSLNYSYQQIRYADAGQAVLLDNFNRQDAYVRAAWLSSLTQVIVDAGGTRLERDQGLDDDGPTLRLTWNQRLNSETLFTVLLGKEFLDPGAALLATVTDPTQPETLPLPNPIIPSSSLAQIYYTNRAEVTYRYGGTLLGAEARAFYRDYEFQPTQPPTPPAESGNRDENGYRLDLAYNPAGTFVPGVFFYRTNTNYHDVMREDGLNEAGARLLYRSTRELSTTLEFRWRQLTSTDPALEYTENRVILGLVYSSNPELARIITRQR